MKDIKTFLIGFLTCCCMFLIMGQTEGNNPLGRYQGFKGVGHLEYLIDTTTGKMWESDQNDDGSREWWVKKIDKVNN